MTGHELLEIFHFCGSDVFGEIPFLFIWSIFLHIRFLEKCSDQEHPESLLFLFGVHDVWWKHEGRRESFSQRGISFCQLSVFCISKRCTIHFLSTQHCSQERTHLHFLHPHLIAGLIELIIHWLIRYETSSCLHSIPIRNLLDWKQLNGGSSSKSSVQDDS